MPPPASDATRSKKKRLKQKSALPSDIVKAKTKLDNQKRRVKEVARRLGDSHFDQLLLEKNRERVRRFRENKKAALTNKENLPISEMDMSESTQSSSNDQSSNSTSDILNTAMINEPNSSYQASESISPNHGSQVLPDPTFPPNSSTPVLPSTSTSVPLFSEFSSGSSSSQTSSMSTPSGGSMD